MSVLTYHNLHITTQNIERTSICSLPFKVEVTCSRVSGWQVWAKSEKTYGEDLIGGEYDDLWVVLDVDGTVICDGRVNQECEESYLKVHMLEI